MRARSSSVFGPVPAVLGAIGLADVGVGDSPRSDGAIAIRAADPP
jgi:hypothetical protein